MTTDPAPQSGSKRRWLAGVIPLVLIGTGALWYGVSGRLAANDGLAECKAAQDVTARLKSLATGEMAAVGVSNAPKLPPEIIFNGPDGQPRSWKDFQGKTVLVNLWATWCVPCRQEMPALDKLQAEQGGADFEVVAVNVDTRNTEKPKAWLQENGIHNLAYYADPGGKVLQTLQKSGHVVGLPTTLIVGSSGCEVALLKGPAEWASPDAMAFIKAAIAPQAGR
ncbi:thiol:disulfide interchange protein TlpA [Microvirga puerhi]|uniref:TlpA family protein disulfide reductase n=1 Tax=Microvirga puerhi TaxID=2876078 RepID=A0ABS7VUX2_9HYPH|nr:TlpA family protein disulfide reductase [Microvirga puerhi]MBZ6079367.1 TlpA family protein disulfide reductase [Microvirga puerhi]